MWTQQQAAHKKSSAPRPIPKGRFRAFGFNISSRGGARSEKLRRSFALPSLKLRSEGGKWAKSGRSIHVAVA